MADNVQPIRPRPTLPAPGAYLETETAAEITLTLAKAYAKPGELVGLIAGAPGVGKSKAVWQFKYRARRVVVHTAICGEGGIWNLANALCRNLEIEQPNGRNLAEARRKIAEEFGAEAMLIIDEAQHLVVRNGRGRDDWQAFRWTCDMAEESWLGLAFVGDLALRELQTVSPGLWRRCRRNIITQAPKPDVQLVAQQHGLADPKMAELLFRVSRASGGALGAVSMACREAQAMAGDGAPGMEHLLAAIEDLRLLPERSK